LSQDFLQYLAMTPKMEASPASGGRAKLVVVVKKPSRRRKALVRSPPTAQHPRTRQALTPEAAAAAAAAVESHDHDNDEAAAAAVESHDDDEASDTWMVLQGLRLQPDCLKIPVSSSSSVSVVLPCQLHAHLSVHEAATAGTLVLQELSQLFASRQLVALSSLRTTTTTTSLQHRPLIVYLPKQDHITAIQQLAFTQDQAITTWFTTHLPDWTMNSTTATISRAQLEQSWKKDPLPHVTLDALLQRLQQCQFLLPNHNVTTVYQLWLPSWGAVIRHWRTAAAKVVAIMSRQKERSYTAVQAALKSATIPLAVLVDWLVAHGMVRRVARPAGTFLQLT
jgi:hypothetical protein